jgi:hypothetical protein
MAYTKGVTRVHIVLSLFAHVKGAAGILEEERLAEQETGLSRDEWLAAKDAEFQVHMEDRGYMMLATMGDDGDDMEGPTAETLFKFGLRVFMDGLGVLLDGAGGA